MADNPAPAATAAETTPDNPWPLRLLSVNVEKYVSRMSALWVEGELVQLNRRPGSGLAFMTVRDAEVDMSFSVPVREVHLKRAGVDLLPGSRIVFHAKPTFWSKRGSLQLEADEVRPVGIGELLARLEKLKQALAAEGLFDAARKRPLPFLPRRVGLICGRQSAAEKDVVVNGERRWPGIEFVIREVAVQGERAVREVTAALNELDGMPGVDVIIISRGGGSVEDLLPFSDESLVRRVAATSVPVVSAIGHEVDTPLLDLVADLRASTPTDAAKRVVPDFWQERELAEQARLRLRSALRARLSREREGLAQVRSRPVLARPLTLIEGPRREVREQVVLARTRMRALFSERMREVDFFRQQVRALSPLSTLRRGYAVVQDEEGRTVTDPAQVASGAALSLRLAEGRLAARAE
ncbi:exodeoxyribonuclease VII large subunit [Dermabacteraceae bacterium P7074]